MTPLNIYLLTTIPKFNWNYESAVVIARSEEEAKTIHPSGSDDYNSRGDWPLDKTHIKVKCIGIANSDCSVGVICADWSEGY